ncbi:MAG: DUF4333 domain-containing protein [Actinomycetales bacterium]|nr:DUF4333 domain-containing protein [Actinomycetales bacterium]
MRQHTAGALVVVAVGLMASGCSSVPSWIPGAQPHLDTSGLAAAVEEVVGVPVTVSCPDDIPMAAGTVTECSVSDGSTSKVLVVTQTDDQGNVDWEISERDAPAG